MIRSAKYLVILALLGFAGLTAFAYFGDLAPKASEIRAPVVLNGG